MDRRSYGGGRLVHFQIHVGVKAIGLFGLVQSYCIPYISCLYPLLSSCIPLHFAFHVFLGYIVGNNLVAIYTSIETILYVCTRTYKI